MLSALDQLAEKEQELWRAYAAEERAGRRAAALRALRRFIDALSLSPQERIDRWVEAACAAHWDQHDPLLGEQRPGEPIRHPLLAELILPALLRGYRDARPNAARWLALFSLDGPNWPRVYDELRCLGMPEFDPLDLLREALESEPGDSRAAHALLHHLAERFDFLTHEVPLAVLSDDTAAWWQQLDEFETLLRRFRPAVELQPRLRFWRLHCQAWQAYEQQDEICSYADFLTVRGLESHDRLGGDEPAA